MFPKIETLKGKPYLSISIIECGEKLVAIPTNFAFTTPHPYQSLGAQYGDRSPFSLREGVLHCLEASQKYLRSTKPNWCIKIFDAYRPLHIQKFMVEHTFLQLIESRGWERDNLTAAQREEIMDLTLQFWAMPSEDPKMPPPHSTGAAIDVTLQDERGQEVNMGSDIDEVSPRSFPDYFKSVDSPEAKQFHANRELLYAVMSSSGFQRHPNEWWHFSLGDQMWAWLVNQSCDSGDRNRVARYGRVG
ncbi:M15 family metallopeptidase [Pseudanabaena sp. PCC 6802]|uniref:M15 family metallopeptidase n=1 Tax=Pseudanabaena sp. PCC 6802 TaxID=118173 RepID=UPI00034B35F3|nr:M15 family metallopeptidase [Pseudanabaena sp. PCC 6802]